MRPTLDIMVLNYNGVDLLRECLPSIVTAASTCRLAETHIVIIDNQSTDTSHEWVTTHWPAVAFVQAPRNDYLFSLNDAARDSTADLLIMLNNDIKPLANSLDPLLDPLLADDRVFSVAPCLLGADGQSVDVGRCWGEFRRGFLHQGSDQTSAPCPSLFAPGAALACRREAFLSLGGFDVLYRPAYWEDTDLGYRAWERGYRNVYQPAAQMVHLGSASWKQHGRDRIEFLFLRNSWLFTWRNVTDPTILAANLFWTLRYCIGAIRRGDALRRRAYAAALASWMVAVRGRRSQRAGSTLSDHEICRISRDSGDLL